jgi:transitional endoplasmic reticulum ATPase
MTQDDDFLEVIAAEVAQDPTNMALREDFVTLLLERDVDRAADEVAAFQAHGGDPARVRLLRARVMAARVRGTSSRPTTQPATAPVPAPTASDPADDATHQPGLWDVERPAVTLDDVAGLAEVKQHLDSTFLAPLRNPELAAAFGQKPGGSLLMYGPPGCGKTYVAKAIAGDLGASFIHVTLADLLSRWLGDSEKAIQSVFQDARAASPCVIFFDEFDALGGRRTSGSGSQAMRSIVTQLLEDARAAILQGDLEGKPADGADVVAVAAATEGFSGADIAQVATIALQQSLTASMSAGTIVPVTTQALLDAAATLTPSTTSWFDQVAPVLEYGVDDGTFAQLRAYRVKNGMR